MREILFRGKRLDNGEWVESHGISRGRPDEKSGYKYYLGIGGGAIVGTNEAGNIVRLEAREDCLYCEVDPDTVGQCTGLKDRNGKRIFEGDLVKYHDRIFGDVVAEIIYSETGVCFCARCVKRRNNQPALDIVMNESEIEVIGNVYDNPELLEAAT